VHPRVTFGALPDDVLLEIFDFYLILMKAWFNLSPLPEDAWHTLVHVCKRWRSIVFASPHRLQLQLLCTNKRPVQDFGPLADLPIVIHSRSGTSEPQDATNIVAALKQHNRVVKIDMWDIQNLFLRRMRAMEMKGPFSALTYLWLISTKVNAPALPESFLGGSAPRLQTLYLDRVPFPALPNLLLSTHDLLDLQLWNIPLSGYITPEAMATCLTALTRLKNLRLEFRFPRSRAHREHRLVPRPTRLVLPALTSLYFKGDSKYLEDIMAQIVAPLLTSFDIRFFNELIFDTPFLGHFISRTETFKAPYLALISFREDEVDIGLYPRNGNGEISSLAISCRPSDWQLSSLAQVCDSALSPLPTLESLEIYIERSWKDDVENAQWAELLHTFTSLKDLLLRGESIQHVALALEQLSGEGATEALPTLQNLFWGDPHPSESVKKSIGKFVVARRLSGRPVVVYHSEWPSPAWQQMRWEFSN
jgi:hypothetical protein